MTQEIFSDNKIKISEVDFEKEIIEAVRIAKEKCSYGLNGKERKFFLDALNNVVETKNLIPLLELYKINIKKLPEILNHESIFELLSLMLEKPTIFRFPIGVLLSCFRSNELPEALLKKINPEKINENFKVDMGYQDWHLCEEAELKMQDSIKDRAVILANKGLLIKFNGRLSALCIKSFSSAGRGIFYEGNWYSPTNIDLREDIKNYFDNYDYSHINLSSGDWAIMRNLESLDDYDTYRLYLERIKKFASTFSEFLPKNIKGMARKDYRIEYQH